MDRFHLGEAVYGPLYRGGSRLSRYGLSHVTKFLQARGALFLLVDEPLEIVQQRLEARGEEFLRSEDVAFTLREFRALAIEHQLTTIDSDCSRAALIDTARLREWDGDNYSTYIGPRRPSVLLLGDTCRDETPPGPAFLPSSSGRYLFESLDRVGLTMDCGIANACDEPNLLSLYEDIGCPPVVTLGQNAADRWRELNHSTFGQVQHPQFARRFHFDKQERYADNILTAMISQEPRWLR